VENGNQTFSRVQKYFLVYKNQDSYNLYNLSQDNILQYHMLKYNG
jgi:hypothetical protein